MELHGIETFVTIARVGGFTRAAEVLHLSQPAVSRRVDLLEREFGAPLFERPSNGIRPTDAGVEFLPYAQRVLAAIEDGRAAVAGLAEERATIVLALVGTLASTRLTALLQAFRADHPLVQLLLRTGRSDDVSTLVLQGDAQLGLRYFADPNKDMCSVLVTHEPLVAICSATSRFFPDVPSEPHALTGVPWVTYPLNAGSSGEPMARILERQLVIHQLDASERIIIDSLTAQKRLIEADFGIGFVPLSGIEEELRLETVRILPLDTLNTTVPVMAIYRRQAYLGGSTTRLLSLLTSDQAISGSDSIHAFQSR